MTPLDFLSASVVAAMSLEEVADLLRVLSEREPTLFRREFGPDEPLPSCACLSMEEECCQSALESDDFYDFDAPDASCLPAPSVQERSNPYDDISRLLETLSREELIEAMKRVVARGGGEDVLRFDTITRRSVVIERRGGGNPHFKDDFVYGFYLRDADGERMRPLRFTHRWSYGIYTMWLIDRVKRGKEAGPLSLRRNREAFCHIYRRLFGLPPSEAGEAFDRLLTREVATPSGVRRRSGRFNDCVRDIDQAVSRIAGTFEGIPLKVRPSAPIGVLPDQISLPPELLDVEIFH